MFVFVIIIFCLVCFCYIVIVLLSVINFEFLGFFWDFWLNLSVGNGYLVIIVYSDIVYVFGIFNGWGIKILSYRVRILLIVVIIVWSNLIFNVI